MKIRTLASALALSALAAGAANATTFSPDFSTYAFPGSQFDVDAPANAYFSSNYGISVSNSYLYRDSRDTFDGIGISNGLVAANYVPNQTGRIDFLDTTNFVTVDFLAIQATNFSAYDAGGTLVSSFDSAGGAANGTFTLSSTGTDYIAYITFTSTGGFGAISGFTYNYDGTTGGGNTDLPAVPEPGNMALLFAGLGLVATVARRRNAA